MKQTVIVMRMLVFCLMISSMKLFAEIDKYDAAVVRALLDSVGWENIAVDSVINRSTQGMSIAEVQRITYLDLSHREGVPKIGRLPSAIKQLPELTTLILSGNLLSDLPGALDTLPKLSRIYLAGNNFSTIPEVLNKQSLYVLNADDNRLEELPEWIGRLDNLQLASFVNCGIDSVPESLADAPALTTLLLDSNRIAVLPEKFTGLTDLTISIDKNSLCEPDSTMLLWLNEHSATPDWQATQNCISTVVSVTTEPVTGTVVHVTSEIATDVRVCQQVEVVPVDITTLSWFQKTVLKAVELQNQECISVEQSPFVVTFTYADKADELQQDPVFAVYYAQDNSTQFIEGIAVDSVKQTVSFRASRVGTYLLAVSVPPSSLFQPSEIYQSRYTSSVAVTVHNNLIRLQVNAMSQRNVHVKLLSVSGKMLYQTTRTLGEGYSTEIISPERSVRSGMYCIVIDGKNIRHRQMIRLIR